jgi:transketolase
MSKHEQDTIATLQARSKAARAAILTMTTLSASGHPGGSMSAIDLLNCLYHTIRHDPSQPLLVSRDRVVVFQREFPGRLCHSGIARYFPGWKRIDSSAGWRGYEGNIEREVPASTMVDWQFGTRTFRGWEWPWQPA